MAGVCRQQILRQSDMLALSEQIAAGMDYLSSQHVVHGDLAARNVLVGAEARLKISDLGLGRHTYPHEYYAPAAPGPGVVNAPRPLPVRWLPPESIFSGVITSDSDVWSLAVTLWEVCKPMIHSDFVSTLWSFSTFLFLFVVRITAWHRCGPADATDSTAWSVCC